MTKLLVWSDTDPHTPLVRTTDTTAITSALAEIGVRLVRWPVRALPAEPTSADVLALYRDEVAEVVAREGYTMVDAVSMTPADTPEWAEKATAAREKFLSEHTHDDDEDRFFARGSAVFYLHVDDRVHAVLCEAGDLLSVPARTRHWFDMGTRPDFVAIRFFHDEQGWIGDFLDTATAEHFPTHDEIRV